MAIKSLSHERSAIPLLSCMIFVSFLFIIHNFQLTHVLKVIENKDRNAATFIFETKSNFVILILEKYREP